MTNKSAHDKEKAKSSIKYMFQVTLCIQVGFKKFRKINK